MTSSRIGRRAVGADLGTPSGCAVVVDVADGSTPGSAVHEYVHAVLTGRRPDTAPALPHGRPFPVPSRPMHTVPDAPAAPGVRPARVIGAGTACPHRRARAGGPQADRASPTGRTRRGAGDLPDAERSPPSCATTSAVVGMT